MRYGQPPGSGGGEPAPCVRRSWQPWKHVYSDTLSIRILATLAPGIGLGKASRVCCLTCGGAPKFAAPLERRGKL